MPSPKPNPPKLDTAIAASFRGTMLKTGSFTEHARTPSGANIPPLRPSGSSTSLHRNVGTTSLRKGKRKRKDKESESEKIPMMGMELAPWEFLVRGTFASPKCVHPPKSILERYEQKFKDLKSKKNQRELHFLWTRFRRASVEAVVARFAELELAPIPEEQIRLSTVLREARERSAIKKLFQDEVSRSPTLSSIAEKFDTPAFSELANASLHGFSRSTASRHSRVGSSFIKSFGALQAPTQETFPGDPTSRTQPDGGRVGDLPGSSANPFPQTPGLATPQAPTRATFDLENSASPRGKPYCWPRAQKHG